METNRSDTKQLLWLRFRVGANSDFMCVLALSQDLDLFPALGHLEEETSCGADEAQSSLGVPGGELHHHLPRGKRLHLQDERRTRFFPQV